MAPWGGGGVAMSPGAGDTTGRWVDVYEGRSPGTFGDSGVPRPWGHWKGMVDLGLLEGDRSASGSGWGH